MSKIKGADRAKKRFKDMAKLQKSVARQAMSDALVWLDNAALANITNSRPHLLGRVTGTLANALNPLIHQEGTMTTGILGVRRHAWYGRLHEFGEGRAKRRPWMSLAFKRVKPKIRKRFKRIGADIEKAAR